MSTLSIDPGNIESGYAIISDIDYVPMSFGKVENWLLLADLDELCFGFQVDNVVIEMISNYGRGMPAGASVFETCIWIGRFDNELRNLSYEPEFVKRVPVKTHLCGSAKAKDSNVIQALIDRFAPNASNRGKGTKRDPGFFYGFKADVWQAMALAVYAVDMAQASQSERNT